MDVPTLMHNLTEELICSVCMQLYREPKRLPCLQVLCLECLNNVTSCPLCQDEVVVPESGTMETLPSCYYLKNLLDILAVTESSSSKVSCGKCEYREEEEASFYCFCCGGFWCNDCILGADRSRGHRVLGLEDFREKDLEVILKRPALCQNMVNRGRRGQKKVHCNEVLKFYCKECKIPVCQDCARVKHCKHEMEYLDVTAAAMKQTVTDRLDAAEKETRTVSDSLRELEEESREIEERSQFVKSQIQIAVKMLIRNLQQQEKELIAEVEKETKLEQDRVTREQTEVRDHLNEIEDGMSRARHFIDCSTAADLVEAGPFVSKLLQDLPTTEFVASSTPRIVFLENMALTNIVQNDRIGRLDKSPTKANQCTMESLDKVTAGLEARFQLVTRNSEGKQSYSPGDRIVVDLASTEDGTLSAEMKVVDGNNGSYEVSCIPKRKGEHKFSAFVNGEEISNLSPVHVKKRSYKLLRTVGGKGTGAGELNAPWGVAVTGRNEIFVCDNGNDRLQVFDEEGNFIRAIEHELLTGPRGICIDSAGWIYVTAQNKILLLNPEGEYAKEISYEVNKGVYWSGITLDEQGNIIVCYNGIHILSPEGKLLKEISAETFFDPFDCMYWEGKIFVSNWATNTVDVLGCDGKLLQEIGKQGSGNAEFSRPTGLAINKTGQLVVADDSGVQVFTADGMFVTKFGIFVLSNPYGVSVSNSGHVIVSDGDEDQLQFF